MRQIQRRLTPTTIIILAATIMIATVMGALFIQSFTFPTSTPATVTSNCPTVTSPTPSVTTGASGVLVFKCGASPAFTPAFSSVAGAATPVFTLPTGLTGVGYTPDSAPSCPGTVLTSNTPNTFTVGSWDYCVSYSNYPSTPPSLSVSWN